ncbi:MAG: RluA family pseudouridine synthase [Candidatus Levybacteria bacterium]|nr:RluA family pseudouridine synthase [Candidatus Levybacteria bacterium]
MNVAILFEDDDVLVLNKPSGVTVNTSDTTTGEETLQNFVETYRHLPPYVRPEKVREEKESGEKVFKTPEQEFTDRAGIVHRLDKETSGVILVAKNVHSFRDLQSQFKQRSVEKKYVALSHGLIKPEIGEINVPVGRLPWNRKQFGVIADGREAQTLYKLVQKYTLTIAGKKENLSFVELTPKTGRTHQIRVHLKYIGYPIFADFLYAGRKTARNDRKLLTRVFLHAGTITFDHPTNKTRLTFEAPLPEELQKVLQLCSILE